MADGGSTLGSRVKRFRLNNNMSVRTLAARVGVSPSFIYQLEQDKVSASYSTLKSIARALHTSVSVLAGEDPPSEWFLVRAKDRRRIVKDDGMLFELLAFTGLRSKKMQPLFFSIDPGKEERNFLYTHDREEFMFVIQGEIEVVLGRRTFALSGGDGMYFMFEKPELLRNVGTERATGLWVVSPPGA